MVFINHQELLKVKTELNFLKDNRNSIDFDDGGNSETNRLFFIFFLNQKIFHSCFLFN